MKSDEKHQTKIEQALKARRRLDRREMKKRGCEYCAQMLSVHYDYLRWVRVDKFSLPGIKPNSNAHFCPFAACPYHELDAVKCDYVKEFDRPLVRGVKRMSK